MKKKQNMLFFLMVLTSVLLISCVIFVSFVYVSAASTIYLDTLCTAQMNILKEFESTHTLLLDSLAALPNQMYRDTVFKRLVRASSIQSADELIYLMDKADQIFFSSESISNVCIYLPNSRRIASARHGVTGADYPGYSHVVEWFEKETAFQQVVRMERVRPATEQAANYTTLFMRLAMGQSAPNCAVAIQIEHTDMYRAIMNAFASVENAMLYVVEEGKLIFSTANAMPIDDESYKNITDGGRNAGHTSMRIDGVASIVSFYSMERSSRLYLSVLEEEYAYGPLRSMITVAALASLGIALACIGIYFALSRRTVRQIGTVMSVLRGYADAPEGGGGSEHLLRSVTSLVSENAMLQKRIYESLPELRENFLRNIASRKAGAYADVEQLLRALEMTIPISPLCLAIMEEDDQPTDDALFDDAVRHISVTSLTASFFAHRQVAYAHYPHGGREYVMAVDMTGMEPDELWELFSDLQEHLRAEIGVSVSFVICDEVTDLYHLNTSFEYCRSMQRYKTLYKRGVILFGRLPIEPAEGAFYPMHAENRLIRCMRNEDMQGAIECLEEILQYFGHTKSPLLIQSFIGQLYARFSELLDASMKRPELVLSQHAYFTAFEKARSSEDVRDVLISVLEGVMSALSTEGSSPSERKCQGIMAYLQENYMRNLSLDDLCADLDISKSYVNQILHRCAHTTFIRALSEIRIESACKLLLDTPVPIAAISEQVGFTSPSYFISTFKKIKGMTPGQYRSRGASAER